MAKDNDHQRESQPVMQEVGGRDHPGDLAVPPGHERNTVGGERLAGTVLAQQSEARDHDHQGVDHSMSEGRSATEPVVVGGTSPEVHEPPHPTQQYEHEEGEAEGEMASADEARRGGVANGDVEERPGELPREQRRHQPVEAAADASVAFRRVEPSCGAHACSPVSRASTSRR